MMTAHDAGGEGLSFSELALDYSAIPPLHSYMARDGACLPYRYYPSQSDKVLILVHCSSWHSRYFMPLAQDLSASGVVQVYTPDLRGHGARPERRGDVDYIGQYEDDLADLIAFIRQQTPHATVILGGHSSGGGLAIRFGGGPYGDGIDAYLLLAPYLHFMAPTFRRGSGGWTRPRVRTLLALLLLNALGIRRFNHLPVMDLNVPPEARDGCETTTYSYRLYASYSPRNYKRDLRRMTRPLLVAAGAADEAFLAENYEPTIARFTRVQATLLEDVTHMGLVVSEALRPVVRTWLEGLATH